MHKIYTKYVYDDEAENLLVEIGDQVSKQVDFSPQTTNQI